MTTPTRHPGVFTIPAADDLPDLLRSAAVTPTLAVADPALAARLGLPVPPLPPGKFRDALAAEAAGAGVPETAVLMVALALIDTAASGLLPPALAAVQLPATWVVGSEAECAAVIAAAEAVTASSRGRVG